MRVLFVRHAEAVDRDEFRGSDMLRPLTGQGLRDAKKAYARLTRLYPRPDAIFSSEAVRAKETADVVAASFRRIKVKTTPLLNPGSDIREFRQLIKTLPTGLEFIVLVGHEPDISRTIAQITSGGDLDLRVKKGACAEVRLNDHLRGELTALLPLAALTDAVKERD